MTYQTEEEQVEALKKWWKENGKSVIGGALIGVAVLAGGKLWFDQRHDHIEMASAEYEAMVQEINQDNLEKAGELGELILGQYSDTPYADLAALEMAKIKTEQGETDAAKTQLHWVIDNSEKEQIKHLARLRLGRILLAEEKFDQALQLVEGAKPGNFQASYEELKGDIYVAKGQTEQAQVAYNTALQSLEPGSRLRQYIEMKIDDLGNAKSTEES